MSERVGLFSLGFAFACYAALAFHIYRGSQPETSSEVAEVAVVRDHGSQGMRFPRAFVLVDGFVDAR